MSATSYPTSKKSDYSTALALLSLVLGLIDVLWVMLEISEFFGYMPTSRVSRFAVDSFMSPSLRPWLLWCGIILPTTLAASSLLVSWARHRRPQSFLLVVSIVLIGFFLLAYFGL